MTIEEINQKIQIAHLKLSSESNSEKKYKVQKELHHLKFQKEIAVIRQKIEGLEKT